MIIDMNMVLLTEIEKALVDANISHTLVAKCNPQGTNGRHDYVNVAELELGKNKNGLAAFIEVVADGAVEVPSIRGTVRLSFGIKSSHIAIWINGEIIVPISMSIDEARETLQNTETVTDTILVKADKVEMRRVFKELIISKNSTIDEPWPAGTIEDLLHLLKIRRTLPV